MTAAYMFAAILLAFSVGVLVGEAYGRRAVWAKQRRRRRPVVDPVFDPWSRRVEHPSFDMGVPRQARRIEVVR